MEYKKYDNIYVIRLDLGEKIRKTLTKFLEQEQIGGGFLYGLGAVSQARIAHYPLSEKKYNEENFKGEFEVTNITGNIAMVEKKPFLHMHITLGDRKESNYNIFGGHLVEGIVEPTLEILLTALPGTITRKFDERTGLKLLDLKTK